MGTDTIFRAPPPSGKRDAWSEKWLSPLEMWGGLAARAGPAARQTPDLGVRLRTKGSPHVFMLLGVGPPASPHADPIFGRSLTVAARIRGWGLPRTRYSLENEDTLENGRAASQRT
jgi:hypothetical protein